MAATAPVTTKRCPGVESIGLPAHVAEAAAFGASKSGKDGLTTRCKACGNAYGKAWAAAKKAGTDFSAKAANGQQLEHPDGTPVFTAKASQRAEREAEVKPSPAADAVARLQGSLRKGWTAELVGGTAYAMPSTEDVETPEGQAALELLNRARDDERKRRNAEAKRAQRARAKAAQA